MKKRIFILGICSLILLAGCNNNDSQKEPNTIEEKKEETIKIEDKKLEKEHQDLPPVTPQSLYIDKPVNTNLAHWITEEINFEEFELECTFIPGGFGASLYLDGNYEPIINDEIVLNPDFYVLYTVTGYPDVLSSTHCITQIEITDPSVNIYGLTINSSKNEIESAMLSEGFSFDDMSFTGVWRKGNFSLTFNDTSIDIYARVTNESGVVF